MTRRIRRVYGNPQRIIVRVCWKRQFVTIHPANKEKPECINRSSLNAVKNPTEGMKSLMFASLNCWWWMFVVDNKERNNIWKPWAPFTDAAEWWLARFFIEHKVTATSIDAYFNQGLHKTLKCERSFQSAYTFQKQLDKMPGAPPNFQYGTVGDGFGKTTERPEKIYDPDGYQLYSEMHTADWWWTMQEKRLPGVTIVIGDAASKGRLRAWAAETLRSVLSVVLEPLLHFDQSVGILMGYSDGYERRCWPILAAWLADHVENCNLLSTNFNMCPKCEISVNKLGEYQADPHKIYARDHGEYRRMYRQYTALKDLDNPNRDEKRELKTLAKWF
ncbi:hypothetical protein DFP73DRAFT_600707 [Morchella snyderi]|nr:hypothetical protein DFP73DRAFT_600707 [Morchella snyderi]